MFILEDPYVSSHLRQAAIGLGDPVLDNAKARAELGDSAAHRLDDAAFAAHYREHQGARLYTNSENALAWVRTHLADTALPAQIESLKDKLRFREMLAPLDPTYRFREARLDELDGVDVTEFGGAFVAKPAVGFFSLGVEIVADERAWPAAVTRLRAAAHRFRGLYPEAVLDLDRFVLEQVIEGDEFAVDAYYDDEGRVTLVNILEHPFAHGADVSDRVYRVRPAGIERWHDAFVAHLDELGRRAGLRNFPIHVELRVDAAGTIRAIEANPLRFGGWCATDIARHAWGLCPYTTYLRDQHPPWERLCEERRGTVTALVVADLPPDLDRTRVHHIDYDGFLGRFSEPLELRRVEDPRHPVFAFLFVRVRDDQMDQLEAILHADLTVHVKMSP